MLVKEFMSTEVVTITEDKNMLEVRELMRSSDKRRLPVVDDISRVRGIITDADVSRTSPTDATTLSRYEANYLLGKLKVRDVMTKMLLPYIMMPALKMLLTCFIKTKSMPCRL